MSDTDTHLEDYAHILGIKPEVLRDTMAKVRSLPDPLRFVVLTLRYDEGNVTHKSFDSKESFYIPQAGPRLELTLSTGPDYQRHGLKVSNPRGVAGWARCGINAGPTALAEVLEDLATRLKACAAILARTRYKHEREREEAKRDQTVQDVLAGVEGLTALAQDLRNPPGERFRDLVTKAVEEESFARKPLDPEAYYTTASTPPRPEAVKYLQMAQAGIQDPALGLDLGPRVVALGLDIVFPGLLRGGGLTESPPETAGGLGRPDHGEFLAPVLRLRPGHGGFDGEGAILPAEERGRPLVAPAQPLGGHESFELPDQGGALGEVGVPQPDVGLVRVPARGAPHPAEPELVQGVHRHSMPMVDRQHLGHRPRQDRPPDIPPPTGRRTQTPARSPTAPETRPRESQSRSPCQCPPPPLPRRGTPGSEWP